MWRSVYTVGPVMQSSFEGEDLITLESRSSDPLLKDEEAQMCWPQAVIALWTWLACAICFLRPPFSFIWGPSLLASNSGLFFPLELVGQPTLKVHLQRVSSVVHLQDQPSEVTIVFILKFDLITSYIFSEVLYLSVTTLVINKYSNCLCPRIDSVTLSKMQKIFYLSIN